MHQKWLVHEISQCPRPAHILVWDGSHFSPSLLPLDSESLNFEPSFHLFLWWPPLSWRLGTSWFACVWQWAPSRCVPVAGSIGIDWLWDTAPFPVSSNACWAGNWFPLRPVSKVSSRTVPHRKLLSCSLNPPLLVCTHRRPDASQCDFSARFLSLFEVDGLSF